VTRGGSWDFDPISCRADYRDKPSKFFSDRYNLGFRLCNGAPSQRLLGSKTIAPFRRQESERTFGSIPTCSSATPASTICP
jgi:hypothetical protein